MDILLFQKNRSVFFERPSLFSVPKRNGAVCQQQTSPSSLSCIVAFFFFFLILRISGYEKYVMIISGIPSSQSSTLSLWTMHVAAGSDIRCLLKQENCKMIFPQVRLDLRSCFERGRMLDWRNSSVSYLCKNYRHWL